VAMISFEEAREIILTNVSALEAETVELLDSLGRVCAEEVIAALDLPSFDNSAMDGYAVRIADSHFHSLTVTGCVPAGASSAVSVEEGCAVKIMTGAAIPSGCDAVIPIEDTHELGSEIQPITSVRAGQHIRRAASDAHCGDTLISVGTPIRPAEISILASMGRTKVRVYRRPQIAILVTGDELVEPGEALSAGKLYNSNSMALAAAVRDAGAIPLISGIARDNREHLRKKVALGFASDALITAAGVSVGDRDFVRDVLSELGVKQLFWQVNTKPGKSMAFGKKDGKPVFSLPGNPVSAMLTFEELVQPALLRMMGQRRVIRPLLTAVLQEDLWKKEGKTYFARVRLEVVDGKLLAWSAGPQDTGFLKTMLRTNGVAVLPSDRTSFSAGDEIKVHFVSSGYRSTQSATPSAKSMTASSEDASLCRSSGSND
jgi:molybdopterin molybdotransferase